MSFGKFLGDTDSNSKNKNLASSSGVPHINLNTLREFEVLLPPRDLQRQFSDMVEHIELMINVYLLDYSYSLSNRNSRYDGYKCK